MDGLSGSAKAMRSTEADSTSRIADFGSWGLFGRSRQVARSAGGDGSGRNGNNPLRTGDSGSKRDLLVVTQSPSLGHPVVGIATPGCSNHFARGSTESPFLWSPSSGSIVATDNAVLRTIGL